MAGEDQGAAMFDDEVLMITGGTGSFGHAAVAHFLGTGVREIRIFSRDETKQEDMRLALDDRRLRFFIGDVREPDSLRDALLGVDHVFHAAALKQVPSCEFYPMEAVRTNVLGAEHVMNAAIAAGVRRVVLLSTDKAVYPVNAMGLSKAMMEKLLIAKSRLRPAGETVLCATRYGNVMASRGSVIPRFIAQIRAGEPLTITDPGMTRFLMSLPESVDLVCHAFRHGTQGDIFVRKAPACEIQVLAEALLEIFSAAHPLHVIGTRHGEKRHESLVSREEMARAIDGGRYFRIPADDRDLDYAKYFVEGETRVSESEDYTSANTTRLDRAAVIELLLSLDEVQAALHGSRPGSRYV